MIFQFLELVGRIFSTFLLSTIYTTVIFIFLFVFYKCKKNAFLNSIFARGIFYYLITHFLIGVALFSISNSYWEDTGMGEAPQLPIGYGQIIYSPDFAWTTFFPDLSKTELNKDELNIENFIVQRNFLCAKVSHTNSISPDFDYIICNLSEKQNYTFATEKEYVEFANQNALPLPKKFYDFKTHLKEYYDNRPKWKKWLLP